MVELRIFLNFNSVRNDLTSFVCYFLEFLHSDVSGDHLIIIKHHVSNNDFQNILFNGVGHGSSDVRRLEEYRVQFGLLEELLTCITIRFSSVLELYVLLTMIRILLLQVLRNVRSVEVVLREGLMRISLRALANSLFGFTYKRFA